MTERKIFEELKRVLEDALAYERGEEVNLRTTEVQERNALPPNKNRMT